jgi:hypothetical protein
MGYSTAGFATIEAGLLRATAAAIELGGWLEA